MMRRNFGSLHVFLLSLILECSIPPCRGQTTATEPPSPSPSQFLHSFTPVPTPAPTVAEPGPLKLNLHDVNILVVTDPHGWVAGHAYKYVDFNFGDLLSFYEILRMQVVARNDKDLLLVLNGDFMHGNLLAEDPSIILPIMRDLPWDAVTFGEHDLYSEEHVATHTEPGGIVDFWGDSLVTSNIDMAGRKSLGNRFTKITLPKSRKTLLVLGFLDPTLQSKVAGNIALKDISETIDSLRTELTSSSVDGILVMAHLGIESPALLPMLSKIRSFVGNDMPVQFITGHTHKEALKSLDTKSMAFEAGYNMHQMGFVSFDFDTLNSQGEFLDTSDKDKLAETLGVEKFETSNGDRLKDSIYSLVEILEEDDHYYEILGCAPQSFSRTAPITADNSLHRLWLEDVVPNYVLFPLAESVDQYNVLAHIQFDELFQNDLPEGRITRNDIASILMHDEEIFRICERLAGDKIDRFVGHFAGRETFLEGSSPVAAIATPTDDPQVYKPGRYELFTKKSEVDAAHAQLARERARHPVTLPTNITMRRAFEAYVQWNWPCDGSFPSSPRPPDMAGHLAGAADPEQESGSSNGDEIKNEVDKIAKDFEDNPGKTILIVLGVMCGLCLVFVFGLRYRRRRILTMRKSKQRRSEIGAEDAPRYRDDDGIVRTKDQDRRSSGIGKGGSLRDLVQRNNKDDDEIIVRSDSNLIDIVRSENKEIV